MLNKLRLALGLRPIAPAGAEPPEGWFEFRGGRCIGTVVDKYNPVSVPLTVYVMNRERQLLQEFSIRCSLPHRKYDFGFELDKRATARDLLREHVTLIVENAFGLRSKLALDGASQLTLIREYFGKPRSVLFDLDFTKGGNAAQYMRGGWSGMEPKVCCSDGPEATIEVESSVSSSERYELTISCYPFLAPPTVSEQRIIVTINDFTQRGTLDSKYMEFLSFVYPTESLRDSAKVTIKFEFPDCFSPVELNQNKDKRSLAFGFKQLTFARLLQPNADEPLHAKG